MAFIVYVSFTLFLAVSYGVVKKKVTLLQILFLWLLLAFLDDLLLMIYALRKWVDVSTRQDYTLVRILHIHVVTPLLLLQFFEVRSQIDSKLGKILCALATAVFLAGETFVLTKMKVFWFTITWNLGWMLLQSLIVVLIACLGSAWFAYILRKDGLRNEPAE